MGHPNNKNKGLWESQYARLGYFLIASSFLVAAFMQLAAAVTRNDILVHAIAALGTFIATLYFFMNFWLALPGWLAMLIRVEKPTSEQVLHTYLIPFSFLAFWLVVWIADTELCWAIPVFSVLGFILLCFVFQKYRGKFVGWMESLLKWLNLIG